MAKKTEVKLHPLVEQWGREKLRSYGKQVLDTDPINVKLMGGTPESGFIVIEVEPHGSKASYLVEEEEFTEMLNSLATFIEQAVREEDSNHIS